MMAGAGMADAQGSGYSPGISVCADFHYGSYSDQPKDFKTGQEVARRVAVVFVEVAPNEMSALARSCRIEVKPGGQVLHFKQPGGSIAGQTSRAGTQPAKPFLRASRVASPPHFCAFPQQIHCFLARRGRLKKIETTWGGGGPEKISSWMRMLTSMRRSRFKARCVAFIIHEMIKAIKSWPQSRPSTRTCQVHERNGKQR
jgi:hypothetical protein